MIVSVRLKDNWAPAKLTGLEARPTSNEGEIKLSWIAPDENLGLFEQPAPVSGYYIRFSTYPAGSLPADTAYWWNTAQQVTIGYANTPGSPETTYLTLPLPGTTYYFAVKSYDKEGNISELDTGIIETGQSSAAAKGFLLPVIANLSPVYGISSGSTTVVITGSGFTGVTGVKFGAENASSYTVDSDTQITAIASAQIAGTIDVVVTNPAGSSSIVLVGEYTYYNLPVITILTPAFGSSAGGTSVVITGSGFASIIGVTGINFGALNAASYIVNSDTRITAQTKAHTAGIVDVVATNLAGASLIVTAGLYTYFLEPVASIYFEPYIFPSPTNGYTADIAYWMAGPGLVNIRVYNEIGRLVYSLEENKPAGAQSSNIRVGRLAPGVYLYLLSMSYDDGNVNRYSKRKFVVIH